MLDVLFKLLFLFFIFFSPNVESMGMRFGMMKEHRPTIGEVFAFYGSILYLPVKLEDVRISLIPLDKLNSCKSAASDYFPQSRFRMKF